MAGDTPDAIALAGHLAGCDGCTRSSAGCGASSSRSARSSRPSPRPSCAHGRWRSWPPSVGRERTVGPRASPPVPRPPSRSAAGGRHLEPTLPMPTSHGPTRTEPSARSRCSVPLRAAAAAVLASPPRAPPPSPSPRSARRLTSPALGRIDGLAEVRRGRRGLNAEPRAPHITLVDTARTRRPAIGSPRVLAGEPGDLVVVAAACPSRPPGREYRCWVTWTGIASALGKMYFTADIAYWVGRVRARRPVARAHLRRQPRRPGRGGARRTSAVGYPAAA